MKAEKIDEKTKNDIRRGIYYEIYEDHSAEGKGLIKVGEGNGFATTNFYDMLQAIFSNGGTGWALNSSPASGVLDTAGDAIVEPSWYGSTNAFLSGSTNTTGEAYMQVGSDTTTKTTLATYALASPYSTTEETSVPNRITASTTTYWSNATISATFAAGFIANGSTIGEIGLFLVTADGDSLIDRIAVADGSFTAITYNSSYPLVITVTFSGF